jgi:hypothetical protein
MIKENVVLDLFDESAKQEIAYMKSHRSDSMNGLNLLAKKKDFIDAYNSRLGRELMRFLIKMNEVAFDKIAALNASDEDKIRYKVINEIMDVYIVKITDYERSIHEIDEKVKQLEIKQNQ